MSISFHFLNSFCSSFKKLFNAVTKYPHLCRMTNISFELHAFSLSPYFKNKSPITWILIHRLKLNSVHDNVLCMNAIIAGFATWCKKKTGIASGPPINKSRNMLLIAIIKWDGTARFICYIVTFPWLFTKVVFILLAEECVITFVKISSMTTLSSFLPPLNRFATHVSSHKDAFFPVGNSGLADSSSFHCQVHKLMLTISFLAMTILIHVNQNIFRENHFICLSSCLKYFGLVKSRQPNLNHMY